MECNGSEEMSGFSNTYFLSKINVLSAIYGLLSSDR
jgi:hypothetical protein